MKNIVILIVTSNLTAVLFGTSNDSSIHQCSVFIEEDQEMLELILPSNIDRSNLQL
jgi:hypothetical protein